VKLARGAELGRFRLGSTVIVLFGPGAVRLESNLASGAEVRMGQPLGWLSGGGDDA
jgi:phosphatidylserine decarboxylase